MAVPAVAFAGTENPSGEYPPEEVPPSYTGTENPGSEETPDGVPPAYNGMENPGVQHLPSGGEARALGRDECQQFKQSFRENRWEFGRCIAAVAMALRSGASPPKACAAHGLSRRPQSGERRSDFSACVIAAARALRQQSS